MLGRSDEPVHVPLLVALGALTGLAFGALLVLIFRRRDTAAAPPINIWNSLGGAGNGFGMTPPPARSALPPSGALTVSPPLVSDLADAARPRSPSTLKTLTLGTTNPVRVATAASNRIWTVRVSTLGPPGSFASFATDASLLAFPSMSIVVPAGDWNEIRLQANEALFAVGSVANTTVSVTATEEAV
jgi:hypothetical protein